MDMWNRQKDSGKNMAELFAENGVGIIRASNNRVQGWMAVKEALKPMKSDEDRPALLVCESCKGLIKNISLIQHDEKNPSDCATVPHEITHIVDAARYYCVTRTMAAERAIEAAECELLDRGGVTDYDEEMCGGDASDDYLNY